MTSNNSKLKAFLFQPANNSSQSTTDALISFQEWLGTLNVSNSVRHKKNYAGLFWSLAVDEGNTVQKQLFEKDVQQFMSMFQKISYKIRPSEEDFLSCEEQLCRVQSHLNNMLACLSEAATQLNDEVEAFAWKEKSTYNEDELFAIHLVDIVNHMQKNTAQQAKNLANIHANFRTHYGNKRYELGLC